MSGGVGRIDLVMACVLVMVSTMACTEGETLGATSTAAATSTGKPTTESTTTASPQRPLGELYDPKPYLDSTLSYTTGPTRLPPPNLDAANAEAASWLGSHAFDGEAPPWFLDVPGREERQCVHVPGATSRMRSGDFVLDVTRWSGPDPVFEGERAPDWGCFVVKAR